jgi:hypothetical protein
MSSYKWHFGNNNDGDEEGFNDSNIINFEKSRHHFVAREGIQNILDAKDDGKKGEPAVAEFKLIKVPTVDVIPNIDEYREILEECIKANSDDRAQTFFKNALKTIDKKNINVLIMSDYATGGVTGIDSEENSNWYNLIRKKGTSAPQGNVGGTFGVGKHASFACSGLRTVLYNTKNNEGQSAFIWKSIFASHKISGDKKRAAGYFCSFDEKNSQVNGFDGADNIKPQFLDRKQIGTDICILDFILPEGESRHPWHQELKFTVMNEYFLAIYQDKLKVVFKDETTLKKQEHQLNSGNIKDEMEQLYKRSKTESGKRLKIPNINYPLLDAYIDPSHEMEEKIGALGKCKLYVKIQKDYPKKVGVMRKPRMLVYQKQDSNLSKNYSALFICDNNQGNNHLLKMEDPTHSEWNPEYTNDINKYESIKRKLWGFIYKELRKLNEQVAGDSFDIDQGNLFYEDKDEMELKSESTDPEQGEHSKGLELDVLETPWQDIAKMKPTASKKRRKKKIDESDQGIVPGDDPDLIATTGGKTDEDVPPHPPGPNPLPGPGQIEVPGKFDGDRKLKKLKKSQYEYRCYQESNSNQFKLVLKTKNDQKCNILFFARGLDKNKNENLGILEVHDKSSSEPLEISDNKLINVSTTPDPLVFNLIFNQNRRFAVEVELYV